MDSAVPSWGLSSMEMSAQAQVGTVPSPCVFDLVHDSLYLITLYFIYFVRSLLCTATTVALRVPDGRVKCQSLLLTACCTATL